METSRNVPYQIGEARNEPLSIRCHVAIVRESEGDFSAIVLNLPGVGSCGDTEDEAIANVREAAVAAVESFMHDNAVIPWVETYDIPAGAKMKWIEVNA
ncbi:MAG: hypothetical protein EXS05_11250 [Planctomycetaceae bacterium]|nr:hypothetical protein [Planctomycetaceae bacterium]